MASGPEHYREAERLIKQANDVMEADWGWQPYAGEREGHRTANLAAAQVHATLALAAATAFSSDAMPKADWDAWRAAAATAAPIPADEPEQEYDPGPEVDDQGGMSEYRYLLPEDYSRGAS